MARAEGLLLAPVDGVIEQHRLGRVERRLELAEVDVLPLAGALAVVERGDQRGGGEVRHEEVGVGDAGADRLLARIVGQVRDAGRRLEHVAVALPHRPGTGGAVHRHRDHDDVGANFAQVVVGQPPGAHRLGGERLGHDVALGDQALGQLDAPGVLHVERAAELGGVEVGVVAAVVEAGLVVDEGRRAAQRLGADAALDPNHLRAVIGEVLGDERTDADPGEIGDADALED